MKRLLAIGLLCASSFICHSQAVDTTVCEILKDPQSFNGKTVRLTATVAAGFDQLVIEGSDCGVPVNAIWLSFPEGSKAKTAPAAMLQMQPASNFAGTVSESEAASPVTLDANKDFKQFDNLLSTSYKGGGMCLGCVRNKVNATLVGRLDGTKVEVRREKGKIVAISGFGNLNMYSARLVLQSVSNVAQAEIDYSKPASAAASTNTIAADFGSGSLQNQPKRAVDAFGQPGDDNGVMVGGIRNEVGALSAGKAKNASPDGVLFNCMFDFERLKGDMLGRAMAHMGEHIADLRNPESGMESASPYQLEFRAWMTTAIGAIGNGQKSLMLPGGYTIWNSSWPQSELNANTQSALSSYLARQALLAK